MDQSGDYDSSPILSRNLLSSLQPKYKHRTRHLLDLHQIRRRQPIRLMRRLSRFTNINVRRTGRTRRSYSNYSSPKSFGIRPKNRVHSRLNLNRQQITERIPHLTPNTFINTRGTRRPNNITNMNPKVKLIHTTRRNRYLTYSRLQSRPITRINLATNFTSMITNTSLHNTSTANLINHRYLVPRIHSRETLANIA